MKEIKFVEAMISRPSVRVERSGGVDTSMVRMTLTAHRDKTDKDLVGHIESVCHAAERHECRAWLVGDSAPLSPVGTIETLATQIDRMNLLVGDEVAIIRLSDLQALTARAAKVSDEIPL